MTFSHRVDTIVGVSRVVFVVVVGGLPMVFKTAELVALFPRRHWVHEAQRWLLIASLAGGATFAPDTIAWTINRVAQERARARQEMIEKIVDDQQRGIEDRSAVSCAARSDHTEGRRETCKEGWMSELQRDQSLVVRSSPSRWSRTRSRPARS